MATLLFGTSFIDVKDTETIDTLCRYNIERKRLLEHHGVNAKFLSSDNSIPKSFVNIGTLFGKTSPQSILEIQSEGISREAYFQLILYPRDAFQILENTAYIHEKYSAKIPKILDGIRPGMDFVTSEVGEQGLCVRIGDILIGTALKGLDWKILEKHGVKTLPFFYPDQDSNDFVSRLLFRGMKPNGHIDPHINGIVYDNHKALFVTKNYNILFHEFIDSIADKFGMSKEIISRKEDLRYCAVNMFQLPDGAVVVPEKAYQTIDKLARYLPQEKIIALPMLKSECSRYDGLRCKTNIIP